MLACTCMLHVRLQACPPSLTHNPSQQVSYHEACARLRAALEVVRVQHATSPAGVLRIEAPLPRGASALRWLQAQDAWQQGVQGIFVAYHVYVHTMCMCYHNTCLIVLGWRVHTCQLISSSCNVFHRLPPFKHTNTGTQTHPVPPTPHTITPCLYFSPRCSPAPATPGSLAAQGSAQGMGATASVGAAALWKGAPGCAVDAGVVSDMQRVLDVQAPRVRVLGGARFSQQQVSEICVV